MSSSAAQPRLVPVDDIELCAQSFGDPADPAILLISGAAASMDWWDDALCELLAAGRRHVVRYDHRDTGRSTTGPAGRPTYAADRLVRDCLGLIEATGLAPVHLVGVSMGGGIAQSIALQHPARVATLTLLSTSPVGGVEQELPPPAPDLARSFQDAPPDPDWSDRDQVVVWFLDGERSFAGEIPVDEARIRGVAGRAFDRSTDLSAAGNHWLVAGGDDGPEFDVHAVAAPTLVVHGTADPLFPLGHGEALAAAIPRARLLAVEGMGHQVPPPVTWPVVVPAILEHTAS